MLTTVNADYELPSRQNSNCHNRNAQYFITWFVAPFRLLFHDLHQSNSTQLDNQRLGFFDDSVFMQSSRY